MVLVWKMYKIGKCLVFKGIWYFHIILEKADVKLEETKEVQKHFCMILLNIHGWLTIEWEIHITFYLSFHIVFVSAGIQYKNHSNTL